MIKKIPDNLFTLEMANNHMGDLSHGLAMIRAFGDVRRKFPEFNFALKFQYRDLDTFIHPGARERKDISYVKRFSETRLERRDFDQLVACAIEQGFLTMATPFDEKSVDLIEDQRLDLIKVASCSFNDWPLLERIVKVDRPLIASTAGAEIMDIDRVVSFLEHRNKSFAILHCVGEYPTPDENLHLGQLDFLKARYPKVPIGFSTHENPTNLDIVKLAVAKGARLFEKHVGLPTDRYQLNAYSSSPAQIEAWLEAVRTAIKICGVGDRRLPPNPKEAASLRSLRRGVFARRPIQEGEAVTTEDVFFAFPPENGQYTANDWSKYSRFVATRAISKDSPLDPANISRFEERAQVLNAVMRVKDFLKQSQISIPGGVELEISHHYGMDRFEEVGLTLLTVVNRGYCKKILVTLPGQRHPEQYHQLKEETFHVLYGQIELTLDGRTFTLKQGEVTTVEPGVHHSWVSTNGAVIEEISTTHQKNDSFYADETITRNMHRKTTLTYWME